MGDGEEASTEHTAATSNPTTDYKVFSVLISRVTADRITQERIYFLLRYLSVFKSNHPRCALKDHDEVHLSWLAITREIRLLIDLYAV